MITALSEALLDSNIVEDDEKYILEFVKNVSLSTDGSFLGIKTESKEMQPLTMSCTSIDFIDDYPVLRIDVRYPIEISLEEILEKVKKSAGENGFDLTHFRNTTKPYLADKENDVAKMLSDAANSVKGTNAQPYTLGGSTYAHILPNAYVYGMNGNLAPSDFPEGRGGVHGVDEAVSLDRLIDAMKIYARALLGLNEIEWE